MIPTDRCSQVNHEVRNGISALVVYARMLKRQAIERGIADLIAFDPNMEKTITRLEKALSLCKKCTEEKADGCHRKISTSR